MLAAGTAKLLGIDLVVEDFGWYGYPEWFLIVTGVIEAIEAEGGDLNAAAAAVDPTEEGPRLFFKKMPRSSPKHIPIHLDLDADDREKEVE